MDNKFVTRFVGYWVVNTLFVALANSFFTGSYTLGNAFFSAPVAAAFSGFLLTVLLLLAKGLAKTQNFTKKGRMFMFLYYWGSASISIWLVARVANISGFGIVRFTWAIALGFAIAISNWVLRQAFKGMKLV